ncbi:MAG: PQQ-dependent sugar dehydrogenase [Alphaproteobacteria bacterium]
MRHGWAAASVLVGMLAAATAEAQTRVVETETGRVAVETLADGLEHPWGLAFLPDGRMLVTERPGRLLLLSADHLRRTRISGTPDVYARGQGGLLDVALAPDFPVSAMVYLSFAEPGEGGASTAVARGRLVGERLEGLQVIFRQVPKVDGGLHFGSRLAFAPDGTLFVTTGERGKFDPAQDLATHLGKVVRIRPDGTVPSDNPFVGRPGVRPEIWSYGHRNIQGAAVHPMTGALWIHEMGPRGGDELNIPQAGGNYGWPLVSWGNHYNGGDIPDPPTRPDLLDAVRQWTPVIAPSGMAFYDGELFPRWRGSVLIGGLVAQGIVRLTLDGERVAGEERIGLGARIRNVRSGPDGAVYALTDEDDGRLLRLSPRM